MTAILFNVWRKLFPRPKPPPPPPPALTDAEKLATFHEGVVEGIRLVAQMQGNWAFFWHPGPGRRGYVIFERSESRLAMVEAVSTN